MSRYLLCLLCIVLLTGCCVPVGPAPRFPPAPTPILGPAPRCPYDVSSAVEETLALLDDPRAARDAQACAAALAPIIEAGEGLIEGAHPFWSGARYRLVVGAGVTGSLSVIDVTAMVDSAPLYSEGISPTQTIAVAVNPEWLAAATDDHVRRAALRACVHVGQHLLRMGHLATVAGVPAECLAGANQQTIVHARQAGYRSEPLAYAVVMLDALETGAPAGPLLDAFRRTFPAERTLEGVVGSPAYSEWRATVAGLLAGY